MLYQVLIFVSFIHVEGSLLREINDEPQLIQLITISRHGARSPSYYLPRFPCAKTNETTDGFDVGPHELTTFGQKQNYELGKHLRAQYPAIPANYSSDLFYFRATDADRTLMSGADCIMGMLLADYTGEFPPPTFPLHSQDTDKDPVVQGRKMCSAAIAVEEKAIEESKEFKDYAANEQEVLDALWTKTGLKDLGETPSLVDISDVSDPLNTAQAHNFERCMFTGEDSYLNDEATRLHDALGVFTHPPSNKRLALLSISPFIENACNIIQAYITNKSSHPWNFYFGHDGNLLSLIHAFGQPSPGAVPFVSYFAFEVYLLNQSAVLPYTESDYGIKIVYTNFTVNIDDTPVNYVRQDLTPNVFKSEYATVPQLREYNWTLDQWYHECGLAPTPDQSDADTYRKLSTVLTICLIVSVLIALVLLSILLFNLFKKDGPGDDYQSKPFRVNTQDSFY